MDNDERAVWDVQAGDPVLRGDGTTHYYRNIRVMVVSVTAQRAIELVMAQHPGARIHQVIRRGEHGFSVIIDERLTA